MTISVYTKPDCPACDATKKYLDRDNVSYFDVDVTTNEEARNYVVNLGYTITPVVVVSADNHWQGFRPDKIASLRIMK